MSPRPRRAAGDCERLRTAHDQRRGPSPVTRERLLGIYDHLGDPAGLPVAVVARNDRDEAAKQADALLETGPDAVIAMSDQLAFAVLDAVCRRTSRSPAGSAP